MSAEPTLKIKVICTELPGIRFGDCISTNVYEPVYLGIQRGKTEVIEQTPANRKQATFLAEFRIGKKTDGSPNFLGEFAQGTLQDRFFYLSWGVKEKTGAFRMFRRLKIRLGHLTWSQINSSLKSGKPIVVKLKLTDKRGGPLCATPPPTHIAWETSTR